MKYSLLTALFFVVFIPTITESRTWHVEPDSTGQVINIQAGIDSAAAGDTVLAAPGLYVGDGNWDLDFNGKAIVVRSDGGATISSYDYFSEPDYAFYFHSGEDSTSVVEGFNIEYFGTGIMIDGSSPTIRNNSTSYAGIHCENSRAIIENNSIVYFGTGIYCLNSRASIRDNHTRPVSGVIYPGPGISCDSDSSEIINNSIFNQYDFGGTAMVCQDSYNIIRGNTMGPLQSLRCSGGSYIISDNKLGYGVTWECYGSGISCSSCSTTISNNDIEGNGVYGIWLNGGTHNISGNSIRGESFGMGVTFYYVDSNTVFNGNSVFLNGGVYASTVPKREFRVFHPPQIPLDIDAHSGGISCYHSSPVISDNVIAFNHVEPMSVVTGSGISCSASSSPLLIRNTIAYNTPSMYGGGITCYQSSSPRIENCIIAYNSDFDSPELISFGISCTDGLSVPTIINCNVYGNGSDNYGGIPDQTGINGNFSIAPLFCDPTNLEFTLHALSPCLPENNPYGPGAGLIGALGLGCDFVATLLQSFDAEYDNSLIEINWTVSDVADISDFDIYRASAPGWEFLAVNDPGLEGGGTSFTYHDKDILPGTTYRYRVVVIDESEARVLFETDRIAVPAMPLALNQNYPNPFNPATTITYYVPSNEKVRLDIYDVSGRLVTRLVDDVQEPGTHSVDWNGTNGNGNNVGSGTYFYRLSSSKEVISRKMVLLK